MPLPKKNLVYTIVFDSPRSEGYRFLGKMLVSSLLRTFFTGDILVFRNSPAPLFLVERKGLEEVYLETPPMHGQEGAEEAWCWKYRVAELIENPEQYDKILFLDADCLVLRNIDHLLEGKWDIAYQPEREKWADGRSFNAFLTDGELAGIRECVGRRKAGKDWQAMGRQMKEGQGQKEDWQVNSEQWQVGLRGGGGKVDAGLLPHEKVAEALLPPAGPGRSPAPGVQDALRHDPTLRHEGDFWLSGANSGTLAVRGAIFHQVMEAWRDIDESEPLRKSGFRDQASWNALLLRLTDKFGGRVQDSGGRGQGDGREGAAGMEGKLSGEGSPAGLRGEGPLGGPLGAGSPQQRCSGADGDLKSGASGAGGVVGDGDRDGPRHTECGTHSATFPHSATVQRSAMPHSASSAHSTSAHSATIRAEPCSLNPEPSLWKSLAFPVGEVQFPGYLDPHYNSYSKAALTHNILPDTKEKFEFTFGLYMRTFFCDPTGLFFSMLEM